MINLIRWLCLAYWLLVAGGPGRTGLGTLVSTNDQTMSVIIKFKTPISPKQPVLNE